MWTRKVHAYAEFSDRQQSFEQLAAFQFQTANVVGPTGVPVRYQAPRSPPTPSAS